MRTRLAILLALLVPACDNAAGPDPEPIPVERVDQYFADLPTWDAFAPDVAELPPTPHPDRAVVEDPVVMDVEVVEDDGTTRVLEDVTYECTTTPYSLADTPDKVAMYDPDRELLYVGAFLQGGDYVLGSLRALRVPERVAIDVSIPDISSASGSNFRTVPPTQAEVSQARGDIIGSAVRDGLATPSSIDFTMETYHAESQFALASKLSARYLNFSGSASGSVDRNASETTIAVQFTQRMYTVVTEPPGSTGSSFFSDDFTRERLQALVDAGQIGPDNLPVYVSNVVYGRMMMFALTSTASEEELRATIQAAYNGIGSGGSGQLTAKQRTILQRSKVTVTSIGGPAEATEAMIQSGDWSQYFTETAELSTAAPLTYTFRNLGDDSIARITEATEYTVRTCDARQATPGTFDFSPAQAFDVPAPTTAPFAADVDGDGLSDLVFAHLGATNDTRVLLAAADGTFHARASTTHPGVPITGTWADYTVRAGDVDGDGRADLVWNYNGPEGVSFYVGRSNGDGTFDVSSPEDRHRDPQWTDAYTFFLADVNGDGLDDGILNSAGIRSGNYTHVALARGDGTFRMIDNGYQAHSTACCWQGYTTHVGDFNADGQADVVWNNASSGSNAIHAFYAKPALRSQAIDDIDLLRPFDQRAVWTYPGTGWETYEALVGDIAGDAGLDVAWVDDERATHGDDNRSVAIHTGTWDGDAAITRTASLFEPQGDDAPPYGFGKALADVAGTDKADLLLNRRDGALNRLIVGLSDGAGAFDFVRKEQDHPEAEDWSQFVLLTGDFGGSFKHDVVWVLPSQATRVYVGLSRD